MSVFEISRSVAAPRDRVWRAVSDVVGYADIAPNISRAEIVRGEGEGMVRRCYDLAGRGWDEVCDSWEEGRRYSMRVVTEAPDYPYPLKALHGTWAVTDEPGGSRIDKRFEYEMKFGLLGRAIAQLALQRQFQRICEELLDNWEDAISRPNLEDVA